jgi:hypothetical protein
MPVKFVDVLGAVEVALRLLAAALAPLEPVAVDRGADREIVRPAEAERTRGIAIIRIVGPVEGQADRKSGAADRDVVVIV